MSPNESIFKGTALRTSRRRGAKKVAALTRGDTLYVGNRLRRHDRHDAGEQLADVVLGLLTGNIARGAEHKLTHFGVWSYFGFGAFADDHHERDRLGPFALARARELGHEVALSRTFVIGDTAHDISCARAIGAKAVAVATGNFRTEHLAPHAPDVLLEDLGDISATLHALGL